MSAKVLVVIGSQISVTAYQIMIAMITDAILSGRLFNIFSFMIHPPFLFFVFGSSVFLFRPLRPVYAEDPGSDEAAPSVPSALPLSSVRRPLRRKHFRFPQKR